jgi:hypothetical protein
VFEGGKVLRHVLNVLEDFGERLLLLLGESHEVESTTQGQSAIAGAALRMPLNVNRNRDSSPDSYAASPMGTSERQCGGPCCQETVSTPRLNPFGRPWPSPRNSSENPAIITALASAGRQHG